MPDAADSLVVEVETAHQQTRRRRWVIGIALGLALAAYLYSRGWATQDWRLADGRTIQVLNWDRHLSITVDPSGGAPERDSYFWVRYYAESRDRESMLAEARGLAPLLFPTADSLGYMTMQLDPSYPVGSRLFPIAVVSWHVRFKRDSAGKWKETGT